MPLILVANPGSSSRKYGLYDNLALRGELHFEHVGSDIACTLTLPDGEHRPLAVELTDVATAATHVEKLLVAANVLGHDETIDMVGLRIVAPSAFFMEDHVIDEEVIHRLERLLELAPIHIEATLKELKLLHREYAHATVVGVSDSGFHRRKPAYAWNYGINIHDADRLDIKRFGYHGLSVEASIDTLWNHGKLPPKVIICHLGSGSSVTGVFHGRTIDTTMGFTPLEGVLMATRSGDIAPGAVRALQRGLKLDEAGVEEYLNHQSGLLGIGGTNDIRELISREAVGDHLAHLALTTLIHTIHKAVGQMLVAMNGADLLVFTGTVGERSAYIRKRVVAHLEFCDFILDGTRNDNCTSPTKPTNIAQSAASKPIMVIPTNESLQIAKHVLNMKNTLQ